MSFIFLLLHHLLRNILLTVVGYLLEKCLKSSGQETSIWLELIKSP